MVVGKEEAHKTMPSAELMCLTVVSREEGVCGQVLPGYQQTARHVERRRRKMERKCVRRRRRKRRRMLPSDDDVDFC